MSSSQVESRTESPLMLLHNGIMLGIILFELENNSIKEDLRDSLFVRIDDLFFEFDIDVNLNHKELYCDVENYQGEIIKSISRKNGDLYWSVFIGINTVYYISSKAFKNKMNAKITNMLDEELSKHGSSIDALDLIISKHKKKEFLLEQVGSGMRDQFVAKLKKLETVNKSM